jgi:hypothetical protein
MSVWTEISIGIPESGCLAYLRRLNRVCRAALIMSLFALFAKEQHPSIVEFDWS